MTKAVTVLMALATLAGCAGQASPYTSQALINAQQACYQGYPNACAALPAIQQQAAAEAQANAQANTAAAAIGVGMLAVLGAAIGVAASNNGGYHHGYGRYHGRYGGWHH